MSVLIAIPVFRIACKVGIDRGRAWSVIDEAVLWAIAREPKSIATLAAEADLPRQIIVASIARLMRFRLVEVTPTGSGAAFRASEYGFNAVSSGNPLPFFPKRISRRVSFVIERATGDFFLTRQIRLMTRYKLEEVRRSGEEVRIVVVEGGGPSMSHEANLNRLSDIAARGWDEQVAYVDGQTATMRDDEYMLLRVVDGLPLGIPDGAGLELRRLIETAATLPRGTTQVPVSYPHPCEQIEPEPALRACTFDPADVVIGGPAQRECLENLLAKAHRRVIVHSTFLDAERFAEMSDVIRAACIRGVTFDLLWGAEKDDETEQRSAAAASHIAKMVREDRDMCGRFRVHLQTTGSHAKLILLDTAEDGWIAGVGSCNWFSSPFRSVELTVVLRDQHVVADVAVALQRLTGRRGLADRIANEMHITARDLRRSPVSGGNAQIAVISGESHDRLIRIASSAAERRFVVGSNRLGSTARPGAMMQGAVAGSRAGVTATILYSQMSGPLKNRHAQALEKEASRNGLTLRKTKKHRLHGKFVVWDDDDLIVTSLNWASASADVDNPWGEIGVHVHAPGIGSFALERLQAVFPELTAASSTEEATQLTEVSQDEA